MLSPPSCYGLNVEFLVVHSCGIGHMNLSYHAFLCVCLCAYMLVDIIIFKILARRFSASDLLASSP